jgi:hypothetical protein
MKSAHAVVGVIVRTQFRRSGPADSTRAPGIISEAARALAGIFKEIRIEPWSLVNF